MDCSLYTNIISEKDFYIQFVDRVAEYLHDDPPPEISISNIELKNFGFTLSHNNELTEEVVLFFIKSDKYTRFIDKLLFGCRMYVYS